MSVEYIRTFKNLKQSMPKCNIYSNQAVVLNLKPNFDSTRIKDERACNFKKL